jgi:hypothetical protein
VTVQVFPTRNIHLVMAFPDAQIDLSMCMDWPPSAEKQTWTDLATVARSFQFIPRTAGLFPVRAVVGPPSPTAVSLLPGHAGAAFAELMAITDIGHVSAIVRVAVHDDIKSLVDPTYTIHMFEGRRDYVLTVFATFTDGESWDVSEHPYLEFDSKDHTIATVDASGRITAVASGETKVWAQPRGRQAQRIEYGVVVEATATLRASGGIAVRRQHKPKRARRRLYLISSGYRDRDRFDTHANEIGDRIFAEANAPFRWLKPSFEVTSVFVRSAGVRGLSIGPPLRQLPLPSKRWAMLEAIPPPHPGDPPPAQPPEFTSGNAKYDAVSLDAFGLMYGARPGDVDSITFVAPKNRPPTINDAIIGWIGDRATRSISVDLRRVGPYREIGPAGSPVKMFDPRVTFMDTLREFLKQLGLAFEAQDRLVFLVDDQLRGGAGFSVGNMLFRDLQLASLAVGTYDDGFDGVIAGTGPIVTRLPGSDPYHADYAATSVVHEIGHTFQLGDEYEGKNGGTFETNPDHRVTLEKFENLQLHNDAILGGHVDPLRDDDIRIGGEFVPPWLKWHVPRAAKASVVTGIRSAGSSTLVVTIEGNAEKIWQQFEQVRLRTSFAVPRRRDASNAIDPTIPRLRDFSYEINFVSGSEVTLFAADGGAGADFADLAVLYLPIGDAQDPLLLIDPLVVADLKASGPFPRPPGWKCDVPFFGEGQPRANLKMPTFPADVVGAYVGGAENACGVIRPAGRCKLRRSAKTDDGAFVETREFCFVCKFVIVDLVDASMLPKVLLHYPKAH